MRLFFDNLDGHGALDYSAYLCPENPLKIERVLNEPSRCSGLLYFGESLQAVPVRRARVVVNADAGTVLFTGYVATEPEPIFAGVATKGPAYRIAFSAISDEWLLDKQPAVWSGAGLGQPGGQVLRTLTNRVAPGLFTTAGVTDGRAVGVFQPGPAEVWSSNAGAAAAATYAAYRVLGGAVNLQPAGAVTHAMAMAMARCISRG